MSGSPGPPAWAWARMSFRVRVFPVLGTHAAPGGLTKFQVWQSSLRQPSLLEIVIGLDDFAQLVLRARIAAVGIGMVALDQLLEARLDLGLRGRPGQIE